MAKLLLVEDDNNLREIYEARLQAEGYEIVSAKDGEEALAVAKAEKPDLVISDIMMPKISGFEMLDILRNTNDLKNIKVIMLTALGQNDDQQRAGKLGADRYLVKSQVTLEDIVHAAHELLEGSQTKAAGTEPAAKDAATPSPASSPEPNPPITTADSETATPPVPTNEPATSEPAASEQPVQPEPATNEPIEASTASQTDSLIEPLTSEEPASTQATDSVQTETNPVENEPLNTPSDSTPADNSSAESASQEKADVESKIEDFVAGASTDTTTPATTDGDDNSDDQSTSVGSSQGSVSIGTDQGTTIAEDRPSGSPNPDDPIVIQPTGPQLDEKNEDLAGDLDSVPEPDKDSDKVTIAHKKVISPPDQEDKPNIEELYAKEQAQEGSTAATDPKPVVVEADSNKKPAQNEPASGGPQDPNSIAL